MSGIQRTSPKIFSDTPTIKVGSTKVESKKINELKKAKSEIERLMRKPNSWLQWVKVHDPDPNYTLNDGMANEILEHGGEFKSLPLERQRQIADLKETILALDKALTLLGYKRNLYIQPGISESEQVYYSWISERLTQFQKDQGLIPKESRDTRSLAGLKTIKGLLKAIDGQILKLQKK